jgi:hypothetical protein
MHAPRRARARRACGMAISRQAQEVSARSRAAMDSRARRSKDARRPASRCKPEGEKGLCVIDCNDVSACPEQMICAVDGQADLRRILLHLRSILMKITTDSPQFKETFGPYPSLVEQSLARFESQGPTFSAIKNAFLDDGPQAVLGSRESERRPVARRPERASAVHAGPRGRPRDGRWPARDQHQLPDQSLTNGLPQVGEQRRDRLGVEQSDRFHHL